MLKTFGAAVLFLTPTVCLGQSQPQKNVLQNLATLAVANQWCDEYKIDTAGSATLAVVANADVRKEPYRTYFESEKEKYEKMMGEYGVTAYCAAAYARFGPGGKIGGLMMKR